MNRARIRDLGVTIGELPTGPHNAITDVPGVLVGHATVIADEPRVARTGVTMIVPRDGNIWEDRVFGGFFSFNGNGEMTGLPWLEESGMIDAAIGISNTHAVGVVRDAIVAHAVEHGQIDSFLLPIAAETYDGWLSDIDAFHIAQAHALAALAAAKGGPVDEGDVGGGTGMICHGFKGGIGTASRVVEARRRHYTVGALVQANYGARRDLRVDGVPVGLEIGVDRVPARQEPPERCRLDHCGGRHRRAAAAGAVQAPGPPRDRRAGAGGRRGLQRQRRYLPGLRHRQPSAEDRARRSI